MATRNLGSLTVDLLLRMSGFKEGMSQAGREAANAANKISSQSKAMENAFSRSLNNIQRNVVATFAGMVSIDTVRSVIEIYDKFTLLENRLKLVMRTTSDLSGLQEELYQVSQRTRTEYGAITDLYIKLTMANTELNASSEKLIKFTEGIGNALTISATAAAQAKGALLQLSQGLTGGIFRAEEFNSVLEGAPEIARVVARHMDGMRGSLGNLRMAIKAGEVSSKQFFDAFLLGTEQLNRQVQGMTLTVDQAMTRLKNTIAKAISESDLSPLSTAINDLSTTLSDPAYQRGLAESVRLLGMLAGMSFKGLLEGVDALRALGVAVDALQGKFDAVKSYGLSLDKLRQAAKEPITVRVRMIGFFGLLPQSVIDAAADRVQQQLNNAVADARTASDLATRASAAGGALQPDQRHRNRYKYAVEDFGPKYSNAELISTKDLMEDVATATDKYDTYVLKLAKSLTAGTISQELYNKGLAKANADLAAAGKKKDGAGGSKKSEAEQAHEAALKYIADLEQQKAVIGLTDAETLKYNITNGEMAKTLDKIGVAAGPLRDKMLALADSLSTDKARQAIKDQIKEMQDQNAVLGLTEEQAGAYDITLGKTAVTLAKLGEEGEAYRIELLKQNHAMAEQQKLLDQAEERKSIFEATRTDAEKYAATLLRLNELFKNLQKTQSAGLPTIKDPAGFGIDLNRPRLNNGDGSVSTERTVTVQFDDRFYNIPTIVDGVVVQIDAAIADAKARMAQGVELPNFGTLAEAETAAAERSAYLGKVIDGTTGALTRYGEAVVQAAGGFASATVDQETYGRAVAGAVEDYITAANAVTEYRLRLAELEKLLAEGLSPEAYAAARAQLEESFAKAGREAAEAFLEEAKKNTQDIVAEFLENPFDEGIKGLLLKFKDMFIQIAAQAIAVDIADALFNGFDDWIARASEAMKGLSSGAGGGGFWSTVLGWGASLFGGSTTGAAATGGGLAARGIGPYAEGGFTGVGSKYTPAGIVHANEYVMPMERVMEPGALPFLESFHRMGMSALPGYASGGLVAAPAYSGKMSAITKAIPSVLNKIQSGDSNVNMNFNIAAPQGTVSRSTQQQIAAAAARGLTQASRRNN